MALVDFVDNIAPPWSKGSATKHWWSMFRLVAVLVDGMIEGAYTGRLAGMPNAISVPGIPSYGGFEDTHSLDLLGQDLQVYRGLLQSYPDYALMLRRAQHLPDQSASGWGSAGLVVGVLEQLAAVLTVSAPGVTPAPPPLMRIVNRAGDWWTRNQDGSYTFQRVSGAGLNFPAPVAPSIKLDPTLATPNTVHAHAWDWDSLCNPAPPPDNGGWWLIVYAPVNGPYGALTDKTGMDMGTGGDLWNDPTPQPLDATGHAVVTQWSGTGGTNAPRGLVDVVIRVILQRQTAGFNCNHVIVAFDASSFTPDGSSSAGASRSAYPDGTWGWETIVDPATHVQSLTRLQTARYWRVPYRTT